MSESVALTSGTGSTHYCIKKCASMQIEHYVEYLKQTSRQCLLCRRFSLEARYETFEDDDQ